MDRGQRHVMGIEQAERFGLSQLHQLRGRSGAARSKVIAIWHREAERSRPRRIRTLVDSSDGFEIAEMDYGCVARESFGTLQGACPRYAWEHPARPGVARTGAERG